MYEIISELENVLKFTNRKGVALLVVRVMKCSKAIHPLPLNTSIDLVRSSKDNAVTRHLGNMDTEH